MPSTTLTRTAEATITLSLDDALDGFTTQQIIGAFDANDVIDCLTVSALQDAGYTDHAVIDTAAGDYAWQRGVYIDTPHLLAPRRIAA